MSWLTLYKQIFNHYIAPSSVLNKVTSRPAVLEEPIVEFTSNLVLKYKPSDVQIVDIDCTKKSIILDVQYSKSLATKDKDFIDEQVKECRMEILNRVYDLTDEV
jgi:hypothetical protein